MKAGNIYARPWNGYVAEVKRGVGVLGVAGWLFGKEARGA